MMPTPEERARKLRQLIQYKVRGVVMLSVENEQHFEELAADAIREAGAAARREEREACLAIAETVRVDLEGLLAAKCKEMQPHNAAAQAAWDIIAAIRAREEE